MKIVHIFWSFTVGGAETMVVDMIREQSKGNNITLIVINKKYSNDLLSTIAPKANIVLLNRNAGGKNPFFVLKLNGILASINPDIIHCHNYNLEQLIFSTFLKRTLLTVHGFNRPISGSNKYSKVIAISKAINNDLVRKGLKNTTVIYNGIRTKDILRKESYSGIKKFVCVGRLAHEIKGQDILLEAFSKLKKINSQCQLYFIGNGKSESYLKNLSNKFNIKESVHFLGAKSRIELYSIIKDFDVLVQPSIHEGFGLTIIEAMVAGLPIIISDASGLMEVTKNGEYASAVVSSSSLALFEEMHNLTINFDINVKEKVEESRKYAELNYSINKTCQNYFSCYKQIILQNL